LQAGDSFLAIARRIPGMHFQFTRVIRGGLNFLYFPAHDSWIMTTAANRRVHVWVKGRVQGVYFRYATRDAAITHNVAGWVRNLPDGRVEAVFEGERGSVEQVLRFCYRGPSPARVDGVEVVDEEFRGEFRGFEIRH
jgi:acylphosphatase